MFALWALIGAAHAQACMCSRNVALPSGATMRSGELIVTADYTASLSGAGDGWQGFGVVDRYGDSMAGMYMPPHFVQTWALGATVGLPEGFALQASAPFVWVYHVHESGMPGDVDIASFGDASVQARWGRLFGAKKRTFLGVSAGATLPTGKVIADTPTRTGKGAVGGLAGVQISRKVSPHVAIAGSVSTAPTLFASADGYRVGSSVSGAVGARWSPRENGRFSLSGFLVGMAQGTDRQDELVYENSGFETLDLALAPQWTVWEKGLRSAGITGRVEAPLYQVVGDPMYAANVTGSLGFSIVAW